MTLGERIKSCRQKAGLSQEKLAELAGVSRQAVTKWEAGQSAPSTENLLKLADASPEQRQTMGENARRCYRENFSRSMLLKKMEALF